MSDGSPAEYSVSSPLDFPMEHLQSFNATYGLSPAQRTYIDSRPVPRHTPLKSLVSPTHQGRSLSSSRGAGLTQALPSHTRASSTSNLGNSYRDSSLERMDRQNAYLGDRSLDMHFEQMHLNMQMDDRLNHDTRYNTTGRDRSLDREYPHMGARSLERDPHSVSRSRSMDRGGEYNYPSATLPTMPLLSHPSTMPSERSTHEFRNSLVFEMQVQISDLHKEVSKLQKELDQAREKLSSSMNSIKTFWSPELKKERAVRKEEAAKCNLLNEQLKVTQAELRKHREMLKDLEERLHASCGQGTSSMGSTSSLVSEMTSLKQERELQTRELLILKRTIEELEIRIDSQKQTLEARDESIKKLLEMLSAKGVNVTKMEEDRNELENLRSCLKEEEQRHKTDLDTRESQITELNLEISRLKDLCPEGQPVSGDHTLYAKLEAKNSRIASLEKEVQSLEDRLLKAKEDSAGLASSSSSSPSSSRDSSLRDLASAKEKLLKVEIQDLKNEVSKKEAEKAALKLKLETIERQQTEREGYVSVLKDQISSKERQTTTLQADIEGLQERVKSKDGTIERKSKETQVSLAEKRKLELEVMELKDQLELKISRVGSLQRKVEGLEDTIREKEDQLSQARVRLTSTFTESATDSALSTLEDTVSEKDKQIERLKEQRDQSEKEHQEELDLYIKSSQDLKTSLDALQKDFTARQTEVVELREQNTELQANKFELESRIRKLEAELGERQVDYQRLTLELEEEKTKMSALETQLQGNQEKQKKEETSQPANFSQQENKLLQSEIDKLQEMLKDAETEKTERDSEIKELKDIVKEYRQKMGTLKRSQQTEKKKSAQLLEEARKREDSMSDDASTLSSAIKKSNDRVEELEEALRQSVIITAEREMAMAELQAQIEDSKNTMEEMRSELDSLHQDAEEDKEKLQEMSQQLLEKDSLITKFQDEREGHLEDVYEMKQEAIQAMISEKDSTLALLEMTSTKNQKNMEEIDRLTKEKHKLQAQLRDVMSNRMKLREPAPRAKSKGKSSRASSQQSSPTSPIQEITKPPASHSPSESGGSSKKQSPDSAIQESVASLESELVKSDSPEAEGAEETEA